MSLLARIRASATTTLTIAAAALGLTGSRCSTAPPRRPRRTASSRSSRIRCSRPPARRSPIRTYRSGFRSCAASVSACSASTSPGPTSLQPRTREPGRPLTRPTRMPTTGLSTIGSSTPPTPMGSRSTSWSRADPPPRRCGPPSREPRLPIGRTDLSLRTTTSGSHRRANTASSSTQSQATFSRCTSGRSGLAKLGAGAGAANSGRGDRRRWPVPISTRRRLELASQHRHRHDTIVVSNYTHTAPRSDPHQLELSYLVHPRAVLHELLVTTSDRPGRHGRGLPDLWVRLLVPRQPPRPVLRQRLRGPLPTRCSIRRISRITRTRTRSSTTRSALPQRDYRSQRAYGSNKRMTAYNTEYGYQTRPPTHGRTPTPATAAAWLNEAEYMGWKTAGSEATSNTS